MTSTLGTRKNVLPVFLFLQCLDILTTLIFLSKGVREGNPLISWALPYVHTPWIGLAAVKLLAMLIGFCCYSNGKIAALRLANVGYAVIVGWNLLTIALAAFGF